MSKTEYFIGIALGLIAASILVIATDEYFNPALSRQDLVQQSRESSVKVGRGSGVVLTTDGRILTNAHVCDAYEDGKIQVTRWDDVEVPATVLWAGTAAVFDVCLIQAAHMPAGWRPVTFTAGPPTVGEEALHIGNMLGIRELISFGTIGRPGTGFNGQPAYGYTGTAGPGSSGGGVFNMAGELIGLVYSGAEISVFGRGFTPHRIPLGYGHVVPSWMIQYMLGMPS